MKKLILYTVSLMAWTLACAQTIPTISTEQYKTTVVFLTSDSRRTDSLKADVILTYDPGSQCVSLNLFPKYQGDFNHVWLPEKNRFKSDIDYFIKKDFKARYRTTSLFRYDIKGGSGAAFKTENCKLVESPKGELFGKEDEAIRYSFRVDDEQKTVRITFASVTPVERYISWFLRRVKYKFHYIADPVTIEFKVKGDPCRISINEKLSKEVSKFKNEADNLYEELTNTQKSKDAKRCEKVKNIFKDSIQTEYIRYSVRQEEAELKCTSVSKDLQEVKEMIEYAKDFKCGGGGVVPPPPPSCDSKAIAKQILEWTRELARINNPLRAGKNVDENLSKGKRVIDKVRSMVKDLRPECKNKSEIKSALDSFQSEEKQYNRSKDKHSN